MAAPVFIHTKLRDEDFSPRIHMQTRKALSQYFSFSSFMRPKGGKMPKGRLPSNQSKDFNSAQPDLFLIPVKTKDDYPRAQHESYISLLWKVRDQVLSMSHPSFARTVSERDWLRNSAKIWELLKNSPIIAEYCKTLQTSAGTYGLRRHRRAKPQNLVAGRYRTRLHASSAFPTSISPHRRHVQVQTRSTSKTL